MHCEIIDHYFNTFFVEIQLKKENQSLGAQTSAPVSHMAWIHHCNPLRTMAKQLK